MVITDTGGGKEIVEDGVSGFVVPVEDPAAIAERIKQLCEDPQLLARFSDNARNRLADEFSSERTIDKFIAYLEQLLIA